MKIYKAVFESLSTERKVETNFRSCAGFRMPGWWDYPRAPAAGVRKAPRHEIAGCGRQQCRGCYGDLATSSGAPVMRRSGSETGFARSAERRLKDDRAAGILCDEILCV